jgi:hypothetical protein
MAVITTNHPNTRTDAIPQNAPKKFLLFNDRSAPKAARIVTKEKIITSPTKIPLY